MAIQRRRDAAALRAKLGGAQELRFIRFIYHIKLYISLRPGARAKPARSAYKAKLLGGARKAAGVDPVEARWRACSWKSQSQTRRGSKRASETREL